MDRYDQWVTREPDYYEPPLPGELGWPRCEGCGAWLRLKEDSAEQKEQTEHCDGLVREATRTYTKADAGILDIIGWEHLGESYTETYGTFCGQDSTHDPHQEVMHAWSELHRTCRSCGKDNIEILV